MVLLFTDFTALLCISFLIVGRCSPVPVIQNADPDTILALNGTVAVYTCHTGHVFSTLLHQAASYCNGLTWNNTETQCTSE